MPFYDEYEDTEHAIDLESTDEKSGDAADSATDGGTGGTEFLIAANRIEGEVVTAW